MGSTPGSMLRGLSVVPGMVSGSGGGGTRDEDDASKGEERIFSSPVTCEAGTRGEKTVSSKHRPLIGKYCLAISFVYCRQRQGF